MDIPYDYRINDLVKCFNSDSICSLEIPRFLLNNINQPMQASLVTACPSSPGVEQLNQYESY